MKQVVVCDYCQKPARRAYGDEIYPHRPDLKTKRFWICGPCKAYVGCHPSGLPFGRLANAELRLAKRGVHDLFDPIWKSGKMTRSEAYSLLAKLMGIPKHKAHVGMFSLEECQKAVGALKEHGMSHEGA
jgi:hypothetical protein